MTSSDRNAETRHSKTSGLASADAGTRVKIIGVGGGGTNTLDRLLVTEGLRVDNGDRVQFAVVNTDAQAIAASAVPGKLVIGRSLTRGLGAGGEVEIGRRAAEVDCASLGKLFDDTDLAFLVVALGGGTGSGAAPVVARAAAERGVMVIAFATMPFSWEGERRMRQARESLDELRASCEAVITLHNDMLLQGEGADDAVVNAFDRANSWISRGLNAVCGMLHRTGLINIDFATLKSAFPVRGGRTLFGVASASGENRYRDVAEQLMNCPLLYTKDAVRTADTLVINIVGGPGLSLGRVNEIVESVKEKFGGKENTVLGAVIDESLKDSLEVCVLGSAGIARRMRGGPARRPDSIRSAPKPEESDGFSGDTDPLDARPVSGTEKLSSKGLQKSDQMPPVDQEFEFNNEAGDYFAGSHSVIDGQDLDVPTYQRRHIRIKL